MTRALPRDSGRPQLPDSNRNRLRTAGYARRPMAETRTDGGSIPPGSTISK